MPPVLPPRSRAKRESEPQPPELKALASPQARRRARRQAKRRLRRQAKPRQARRLQAPRWRASLPPRIVRKAYAGCAVPPVPSGELIGCRNPEAAARGHRARRPSPVPRLVQIPVRIPVRVQVRIPVRVRAPRSARAVMLRRRRSAGLVPGEEERRKAARRRRWPDSLSRQGPVPALEAPIGRALLAIPEVRGRGASVQAGRLMQAGRQMQAGLLALAG